MNRSLFAVFGLAISMLGCSTNANVAKSNTRVVPVKSVAVGFTTQDQLYDLVDQTSTKAWRLIDEADDRFPNKRGVKDDFAKVPAYVRSQLPALKGKHVNVILQDHGAPGNHNITPEQSTVQSQAKITEALNQLKPRVLAIEGFSQNNLNTRQDVLREMTIMLPPEAKQSPDYDRMIEEAYLATLNRQAGVKYALTHSDCHAFGAELLGINVFTYLASDQSAPPEARTLYGDVQPVRSWVMLSRLSEFMDKYKASEGTLIIGSLHYAEIRDAATIFKFDVNFINTVR